MINTISYINRQISLTQSRQQNDTTKLREQMILTHFHQQQICSTKWIVVAKDVKIQNLVKLTYFLGIDFKQEHKIVKIETLDRGTIEALSGYVQHGSTGCVPNRILRDSIKQRCTINNVLNKHTKQWTSQRFGTQPYMYIVNDSMCVRDLMY